MTHSSELIEKVKAEIRYKAKYAGIPFDEEDIEHHEIEDHTLVALMKIKTPETEIIDDMVIQVGEKQPNIWVTYPRPSMPMDMSGWSDWAFNINVPLPDIHILRPSLVFLILPDGTIKGDQALYPLHRYCEQKNAEVQWGHSTHSCPQ